MVEMLWSNKPNGKFENGGWAFEGVGSSTSLTVPLEQALANATQIAYMSDMVKMPITIVIDDDGTDDPVVTADFHTPRGVVKVMAEISVEGRRAFATGVHVSGVTVGSREFGATAMRRLAQAAMEVLDVDQIYVAGARRTSGANPGRQPRAFWIPRAPAAEAGDGNA